MVTIKLGKSFEKHFRTRIHFHKNLVRIYKEQVLLFIEDRQDPSLQDHVLSGKLNGMRAFSVTGDIRVLYVERGKDYYVFLDIGTHRQIYGM